MPTQPNSTQRLFTGACLLVVVLLIAFPLYQALYTGGYVFFTNGIDEASYLSFPYSQLLLTWQGVTRYSSSLIVLLHTLGISGGYCNVFLDLFCVVAFLFATRKALRRYGLADEDAAIAALLTFLLPLLTTTWNPLIAELRAYLFSSPLFQWITLAPNDELLFLRSPEPQLSWTIIALVIAYTPHPRLIPWLLLCISPFLYSFVRLPLIFVALVQLLPRAFPLATRLMLSFLATSALVATFVEYSVSVDMRRFVVASHAPVLSLSGLAALVMVWVMRKHIPTQWRDFYSTLATSTWVGANTQIISGWMISPSKYDEYWSAVGLLLMVSVTIVLTSKHKRRWVAAALCVFGLHTLQTFSRNETILAQLTDPKTIIEQVRESPEQVAFDDILLATTADLMHPRQNHTLLSFTKTYELTSPVYLRSYLCAKQDIEARGESVAKRFTDIFARLDWGYKTRGVDDTITMRRRPLEATALPSSLEPSV